MMIQKAMFIKTLTFLAISVSGCIEMGDISADTRPSRADYCLDLANHREGGYSLDYFNVCLRGPGATDGLDAGTEGGR